MRELWGDWVGDFTLNSGIEERNVAIGRGNVAVFPWRRSLSVIPRRPTVLAGCALANRTGDEWVNSTKSTVHIPPYVFQFKKKQDWIGGKSNRAFSCNQLVLITFIIYLKDNAWKDLRQYFTVTGDYVCCLFEGVTLIVVHARIAHCSQTLPSNERPDGMVTPWRIVSERSMRDQDGRILNMWSLISDRLATTSFSFPSLAPFFFCFRSIRFISLIDSLICSLSSLLLDSRVPSTDAHCELPPSLNIWFPVMREGQITNISHAIHHSSIAYNNSFEISCRYAT